MKKILVSVSLLLIVVTAIVVIFSYTQFRFESSNYYNSDIKDIAFISLTGAEFNGRYTLSKDNEEASEWLQSNQTNFASLVFNYKGTSINKYYYILNFPLLIDEKTYLNIFDYLHNYSGTNVFEHISNYQDLDIHEYLNYLPFFMYNDIYHYEEPRLNRLRYGVPVSTADVRYYIGSPYTQTIDGVSYVFLDWKITLTDVRFVPNASAYVESYSMLNVWLDSIKPDERKTLSDIDSFGDIMDYITSNVSYPFQWAYYTIARIPNIYRSFKCFL